MSTIRTLTMIAALTAGAVACHAKAADKAAAEPVEKAGASPVSAAKPASDTPAAPPAPAMSGPTSSAAGPTSAGTVADADAERFYSFIEQLVAVAVANQDDCAKMAAGVAAFADANKVLIKDAADMQKQHKELPPGIKAKMAKKFKDELGPAVTKKCGKDKAVMDAFQKIKAH